MRQSRECAVDLLPDKGKTRDNGIAQGAEQIDRDYFNRVCLLPVPNGWVLLLQKLRAFGKLGARHCRFLRRMVLKVRCDTRGMKSFFAVFIDSAQEGQTSAVLLSVPNVNSIDAR
jgi:hypothetical protein